MARILADNFGARSRFGFMGEHGSPITSAPKLSDMWFVEMMGTNGRVEYSHHVKSVSPISINTEYQSVDQYGKRIHVPTRVNFPEVQIELYDIVDGSTFTLVKQIYETYFKNNSLPTDEGALNGTIADNNSGLKFNKNSGAQQFNHFFKRFTIYHVFAGGNNSSSAKIQKIDLVNPLVTNMTFSQSDYSDAAPRTITLTLLPENIIIRDTVSDVNVPYWMQQGAEGMAEALLSESSVVRSAFNDQISQLEAAGFVKSQGITGTEISTASDNLNLDTRSIDYMLGEDGQWIQNLQQVHNLTRLYNAIGASSTTEERVQAQAAFLEARNNAQPIPASAINYWDFNTGSNGITGTSTSRDVKNIQSSTKVPNDIPYFADTRTQAINGGGGFSNVDLGNILTSELLNSFFNGTKFSFNNVGDRVAQQLIGNTGIGRVGTLNSTAQSRYGVAGDMLKDSISQYIAPTQQPSSRPTTISASAKDTTQGQIDTIRNVTRNKLR